jgi:hypothetical protein
MPRLLNLPNRNLTQLFMGMAFLIGTWNWLFAAAADNETQTVDLTNYPLAATLLGAALNVTLLASQLTIENFTRIIVTKGKAADYSRDQNNKDINFLSTSLLEIYQENLIDHCKLECLINFSDHFKIIIETDFVTLKQQLGHVETSGFLFAVYINEHTAIYLPHNFHTDNKELFKKRISHELRHAVDAFNNFQVHLCLETVDQQTFAFAAHNLFAGSNSYLACTVSELDATGFAAHLKADKTRMENLYELLFIKTKAQKTTEELQQVQEFWELFSQYNYRRTLYPTRAEFVPKKELQRYGYKFDTKTQKFHAADKYYLGQKSFFVQEANYINNSAAVYFTPPQDISPRNMARDMFLSLSQRLSYLETDTNYQPGTRLMEYSAFIDEVLALYSHRVAGQPLSLREWMFPQLTEFFARQASEPYQKCLRKGF